MIPRYQRILLVIFLSVTVVMAAELLRMRAMQGLLAAPDTPLVPSPPLSQETIKLLLASDADDSLTATEKNLPDSIPFPASPTARARAVLQALFAQYAAPGSPHPIAAGSYLQDVYLLPVDIPALATPEETTHSAAVAVVSLDSSLAAAQPQGEATEMLTLRSIVGTLHANLPQIVAVRFLITGPDGQPSQTLAGHASLEHIYSATEEKEIAVDKEMAIEEKLP